MANITGGEGNDTLTGTTGNDTINGRDGNDTLTGLSGNDSLIGGGGFDFIYGGDGGDVINGGTGLDTIWGDVGDDVISGDTGTFFGGAGNDQIRPYGEGSIVYGDDGNDFLEIHAVTTTAYGGNGDDFLSAADGTASFLFGGDGDDYINDAYYGDAGAGNDIVSWTYLDGKQTYGGDGHDTLLLIMTSFNAVPTSRFSPNFNGFEEIDFSVPRGYESQLSGNTMVLTDDNFGETDVLSIRTPSQIDGSQVLQSGLNLSLYAIGSSHRSIGSQQDDVFRLESTSSTTELFGENGQDTFFGLGGIDTIYGGNGNDYVSVGGGNDFVEGGAGDDFIDGGDGTDVAVFSGNATDYTITEAAYNTFTVSDTRGIDGIDTIVDVNVLRFADGDVPVVIQGLNIVGDSSGEDLDGGDFADLIDGAGGNDDLNGNGGSDSVLGGTGNDTIDGQAGNDFLIGGDGSDTLYAADGNDSVDGGTGNDTLIGGDGRGNDTYNGGSGIDTVVYRSSINNAVLVNLSAGTASGVEIGTDRLSGVENVIGGERGDTITGNSAANVLNGYLGSDTLIGGAGNDTYITDGGDTITENANQGTDTLQSSVSLTLGANMERLTLTGSAAINGTGNTLANTITGNTGANSLNGAAGTDTLTGGTGSDSFVFNAALGSSNIDRITDYNVAADTIRIENAVFTGLAGGTLAASAFVRNTSGNAADASDRIIYETDTGRLYFDRDGTGGAAKVHFATIGTNLAVTNADFFVF